MAKTPVAVSLQCCQKVIVEEGTKNLTLVNCFSRQKADTFPSESTPFVVFAMLTDGQGEMPVQIRIDRLDTGEEIYNNQWIINLKDPLQEMSFCFQVRSCVFPVAAYYEVCLIANHQLIGTRKIRVLQRNNPNE